MSYRPSYSCPRALVVARPTCLSSPLQGGVTPLHAAAFNDHTPVVALLLATPGVNPLAVNEVIENRCMLIGPPAHVPMLPHCCSMARLHCKMRSCTETLPQPRCCAQTRASQLRSRQPRRGAAHELPFPRGGKGRVLRRPIPQPQELGPRPPLPLGLWLYSCAGVADHGAVAVLEDDGYTGSR